MMEQNFVPAKSRRLVYSKGKLWEYNWNTSEAFVAAGKDPDCWGISADVRKTSDGYYVCFHDAAVDAHTDGTGAIESMTWEQIQQINVDTATWNGNGWTAQPNGRTCKIPLVTDFLDICRQYGKIAILETKAAGSNDIATMPGEDIDAIMEYVYDRGMTGSFSWITTNAGAAYLRESHPDVFKIILFESPVPESYIDTWATDPNLIFAGHNSVIEPATVSKIHKANSFIAGYAPRSSPQSEFDEMSEKNLDLIFTFREPPKGFNE